MVVMMMMMLMMMMMMMMVVNDLEESAEFTKQIFHWLNEFVDNHNIEEKIVFEQSMKIMKIIDKISDEDVIEIRKKYGFS